MPCEMNFYYYFCSVVENIFEPLNTFLFNHKKQTIMTAKEEKKQFDKKVKQQNKELLELLLKKTGVKRQDLIDMIYREFVIDNLSLLTPAERKQFDCLAI